MIQNVKLVLDQQIFAPDVQQDSSVKLVVYVLTNVQLVLYKDKQDALLVINLVMDVLDPPLTVLNVLMDMQNQEIYVYKTVGLVSTSMLVTIVETVVQDVLIAQVPPNASAVKIIL